MLEIEKALKANPGSAYVDVGAYTGRFSLALAVKFPRVAFHLIEAENKNYQELVKGAANLSNVHVYHMAIGSSDGVVRFYVSDNKKSDGSSQANSLYKAFFRGKSWAKNVCEESVSCKTFDSFCVAESITDICVLKMNCEGGEYEIFSVEVGVLKSCKLLILQVHGKCKKFLSPEFESLRIAIGKKLIDSGMIIIAQQTKGIEVDHVRQIWGR